MGIAIDTVLGEVTNSAALIPATIAAGDSTTVRSFPPGATATLEYLAYQSTVAGTVRVTSPMLHDNVRGISYSPAESPAAFLLPRDTGQPLVSQDTLLLQASNAAAGVTAVGLGIYYSNLSGQSARLHSWGDISGLIKNIKPLTVAVAANATVGQWSDTLITATEDLLHANQDYAVLGYDLSAALAVVGIKGQETGNLRVCGPGASSTLNISDYFVSLGERMGTPHIPVFNSANKNNTYVSVASDTASAAATVTLILAELTQNLAS